MTPKFFRRKKESKRNDASSVTILDSLKDEEILRGDQRAILRSSRKGRLDAPSRSQMAPTTTRTSTDTAFNNINVNPPSYRNPANGHYYSFTVGKVEQDYFRQKLQNHVPLMEVDCSLDDSSHESDYPQSNYYVVSQDITDCETSGSSSTNSRMEAPRVFQFLSLFCLRPKACLMQSNDSSDSDDLLQDSVDDETEKSVSVVSAARRLPSDLGWNALFENQGTIDILRKIGTLDSGVSSFNDRDGQDSLCAATCIIAPPRPLGPITSKTTASNLVEDELVSENDDSTFLESLYYKSLKDHVEYDSRDENQDGAAADCLIATSPGQKSHESCQLQEPPVLGGVWRPVEEDIDFEYSSEDTSVAVSVPDQESLASIELKLISSLSIRKVH